MLKGAHIAIRYIRCPLKKKDKSEKTQWQLTEEVHFLEKVNSKYRNKCEIIINVLTGDVLKAPDHVKFEDVIKHVSETYPEKFAEFMNIIGENMVQDIEKIKNIQKEIEGN
mgnify:CR=1 FL=1